MSIEMDHDAEEQAKALFIGDEEMRKAIEDCDAMEATCRVQGDKLARIAALLLPRSDITAPSLSQAFFTNDTLEAVRVILVER